MICFAATRLKKEIRSESLEKESCRLFQMLIRFGVPLSEVRKSSICSVVLNMLKPYTIFNRLPILFSKFFIFVLFLILFIRQSILDRVENRGGVFHLGHVINNYPI